MLGLFVDMARFSLFGVVGLIVPKYDIEPFDGAQDKFRGFTEFQ